MSSVLRFSFNEPNKIYESKDNFKIIVELCDSPFSDKQLPSGIDNRRKAFFCNVQLRTVELDNRNYERRKSCNWTWRNRCTSTFASVIVTAITSARLYSASL